MVKANLLKVSFVWNFPTKIVHRILSNILWLSNKTREMFSFIYVTNNSVTTGLSFLLLSISAIISWKIINILRFLFKLYSSIFLLVSSITFEYSIKSLEWFRCVIPARSTLLINKSRRVTRNFLGKGSFLGIRALG